MTLYGVGMGEGGGGPAPWPGKIVRIRISVYFSTKPSLVDLELGRCDLIEKRVEERFRRPMSQQGSEAHENVHVHEKGEKRGRNFKRWLLISS